jgi:hypothetical protein
LAIIGERLPGKADLAPVLASCVFLVFSWSMLWFFQQMPGWMAYLDSWDILGILAYIQAFALLESVIVLLLVIVVAIVLPANWFRDRFAAQGSMMVFVITFWTVLFQGIAFALPLWSSGQLLFGLMLPLVSIVVACALVHRSEKAEKAIRALADRLTVFLYIYVPLGFLGLIVVVARNIL